MLPCLTFIEFLFQYLEITFIIWRNPSSVHLFFLTLSITVILKFSSRKSDANHIYLSTNDSLGQTLGCSAGRTPGGRTLTWWLSSVSLTCLKLSAVIRTLQLSFFTQPFEQASSDLSRRQTFSERVKVKSAGLLRPKLTTHSLLPLWWKQPWIFNGRNKEGFSAIFNSHYFHTPP